MAGPKIGRSRSYHSHFYLSHESVFSFFPKCRRGYLRVGFQATNCRLPRRRQNCRLRHLTIHRLHRPRRRTNHRHFHRPNLQIPRSRASSR